MRKKRPSVPINAGSMADIAFLLLIFFLVSTQILNEKGIKVLLPEYSEIQETGGTSKKILKILINSKNELMVNSEISDVVLLKNQIKTFILNPEKRSDLASRPDKGIISITSDDETSYERYVQVYSEIKEAYIEIWKQAAKDKFGKPVERLSREQVKEIKNLIPLNISELEKHRQ